LIFDLPKLKSIKFSAEYIDTSFSLPFALEKQMSTIEHLLIDHPCTLNELTALLSYTPQLRRLKYSDSNDSNSIITNILPIRLENLTNISFDVVFMTFDKFKMFMKNFECKLKVLHFNTRSEDKAYLDGKQWEEFILKYLPQLEKFYFQYDEEIELESHGSADIDDFNEFTSSFWVDRKWVFETEMDSCTIMHSIRPYK
jgi:hypothetical protein